MTDILIAFAVVVAVALVAGVLLALISHFFGVQENEKVKKIREALPGVNCGACGYKGCDDYALALCEGKVKPNLCVPGAEYAAGELASILGVEVELPKDEVAFVNCNGNCEATGKKASYEGVTTCRAASMIYGGPNACSYGCIGLGDCAAVCPSNAICMKDGIAHIDTSVCLGCSLCKSVCPKSVISMVPQDAVVVIMCNNKDKGADARKICKNSCIACKKCEKNCPEKAITVVNNLATVDYSKCTGCGSCVEGCVTGAAKKVFFPDISPETDVKDII